MTTTRSESRLETAFADLENPHQPEVAKRRGSLERLIADELETLHEHVAPAIADRLFGAMPESWWQGPPDEQIEAALERHPSGSLALEHALKAIHEEWDRRTLTPAQQWSRRAGSRLIDAMHASETEAAAAAARVIRDRLLDELERIEASPTPPPSTRSKVVDLTAWLERKADAARVSSEGQGIR